MKILIAEDDAISSRVLASSVSECGYEPVVARDGQEAWAVLDSQKNNGEAVIQLAILDWQMPRLDGIELCRRIRSQTLTPERACIYIILLTGRGHQEDILRGLRAGADDYLTKPFDQFELQIRLKNGMRVMTQEQQILDLTVTDKLTKLWNREKIVEFLEDELDRNSRLYLPTGVILAEVDNLHKINDTYGRTSGDRLLSDVGMCLKSNIRRYDRLGRFGEDEFLLVFPNCGRDHLSVLTERLCRAVADIRPNEHGLDPAVFLGGVSAQPSLNNSGQALIEAAQKAAGLAKHQGRNRADQLDPERPE